MKQHPKYDHLLITEDGQVFSTKSGKFLKFVLHQTGYYVFSTRLNGRKSKPILLRVHRLVAETYIENTNGKPHVNHIDGVKTNNNLSNLEWVTPQENSAHSFRMGLSTGSGKYFNSQSKVSPETVAKAKELREKGMSFRAIAKELGTCHSRVQSWITW